MNQPSGFQLQHPLSPKKFWKKMFTSFLTLFLLSILPGLGIGAVLFFSTSASSSDSMLTFLGYAFFSTLLSYVIIMSLYAWYIKTYIRTYYYDCNEQFVTIKKGVFAPTEIHVQYQKIQDVYVDQDIIDRLFGIYDVHIASATFSSGIESHIDGVEHSVAEAIKNFMLIKIQGGNTQQGSGISGGPQIPQAPKKNPSFHSDQKISSDTFPISGAWTFSAIVGAFFYSLLLTWILGATFARLITNIFSPSEVYAEAKLSYVVVFFLFVFFIRIVWVLLWKSNYHFELLPDYILLRTGVISRSENHLPYKSIQNVTNKQSIIDRILGISTVSVENAAFATTTTNKSFSLSGGGTGRSSGISIIGQPRERAEQLNQLLNQIVSSQTNSNTMGV